MRLFTRLLLIGMACVALVLAACGDDDGGGSATPADGSPSASATGGDESPEASPDETDAPDGDGTPQPTEGAPSPVVPTLAAGERKVGEGTIDFVLPPNGEFNLDGQQLFQPGDEVPPCAAFVFTFDWQITDPYPPGDNTVQWRITNQDINEDVAEGPDGAATVGCGQLTATNPASVQLSVAVHYVQASTE